MGAAPRCRLLHCADTVLITALTTVAIAVATHTGAMAQSSAERMAEAVSDFAIVPPAGYVATPDAALSTSEVAFNVTRTGEPDTACRVSFEAIPGFSQFTQIELNLEAERP